MEMELVAPRTDRRPDVAERPVPLVVELEGTLVGSDLLIESLFALAKRRPLLLLKVPFWLASGKARFKRCLAEEAAPDVRTLPYRQDLLAYLEKEKRRGVPMVLVTSADERVAEQVARHLGLFEAVLASDGTTDLSGERKADRLVAEFGAQGFDYAGSSRRDRPVWHAARSVILVGHRSRVSAEVARATRVAHVFEGASSGLYYYFRALRPYQWLKNSLVFVPLLAAHRLREVDLLADALLALVAFSLCASSAYILNDLMDLPSDRHHPRKRNRPLASGRVRPAHAVGMIPLLLASGIACALYLPRSFLGVLAVYYCLTLAYSFRLRDLVILDVLALAGLYTLRVMAGSAAVGIAPSAWLLAFCVFLFFSLAMVKRYAELVAMRAVEGTHAHARGYLLEDSELLAALGGASGFLAVLVLALYITSDTAHLLYGRQQLIWLVCVLLLYWISYMWLMAHRARMHDDPLVFALRDRVSQTVIVLMAAILFVAT
jgi:4-hydroxybenzoate polyprenyltransferase/phosphoglycolate phosphatase-like HAD superfamily hydrolase